MIFKPGDRVVLIHSWIDEIIRGTVVASSHEVTMIALDGSTEPPVCTKNDSVIYESLYDSPLNKALS